MFHFFSMLGCGGEEYVEATLCASVPFYSIYAPCHPAGLVSGK